MWDMWEYSRRQWAGGMRAQEAACAERKDDTDERGRRRGLLRAVLACALLHHERLGQSAGHRLVALRLGLQQERHSEAQKREDEPSEVERPRVHRSSLAAYP
jgi:hypothetical protein